MPITRCSIRWSCLAAVASAITLGGCGEAPTSAPIVASAASSDAGAPTTAPVIVPEGSTTEPMGATATPEPAASRDRALLDASAAQVRDDVRQTANSVGQGTDELRTGVTQAVGSAQSQAKQAASDAADGAKGFAAELRDDATRSVNSAVSQAKTSAQGAADGAKQQVRTAVDGAKDNVRRRAKAAAENAAQQAEEAEAKVLNGLLGPAPKK